MPSVTQSPGTPSISVRNVVVERDPIGRNLMMVGRSYLLAMIDERGVSGLAALVTFDGWVDVNLGHARFNGGMVEVTGPLWSVHLITGAIEQ